MGYPKDRVNRSKAMPPNLVTLFAHVMSRANEGARVPPGHDWAEVLQPVAAASSSSPTPFPMSAQDWRKAEAFSVQLQSLLTARHARFISNGHVRAAVFNNVNGTSLSDSPSAAAGTPSNGQSLPPECSALGKGAAQSNGRVKGKGKVAAAQLSHAVGPETSSAASGAATPNPAAPWPRHFVSRVTPKESSRVGEPSAPTKAGGRVAASRRVNGGADGAVASLAVSSTGLGAFETPSHSSHHIAPPGAPSGGHSRGRDSSPTRYPARLRSRRFPQLGGGGDSPEPPQPPGRGHEADNGGDGNHLHADRRLSPRHSSSRGQHPHDWLETARENATGQDLHHGAPGGEEGQSYGMRTRAAPRAAHDLETVKRAPSGARTPQLGTSVADSPAAVAFRAGPPPTLSAVASVPPMSRPEVTARPRQLLQGSRAGSRAAPVPRSSVGGRNYTDNQVKQLGLIEASVVASATAKDRAMYNLPRQGRTLTLTNVFKFVALRGAGAMYRLATEKQVEAHTGRHSNFFDGKIDARIVSVIRKDIGDETITKSRKFSKVLLSLIAEGCAYPDCDWDHNSFTSEKIADMQARLEAEAGTSALQFCNDAASAAATAVGAANSLPSTPLSPSSTAGSVSAAGAAKGVPSKRRLDLGRDVGRTPSPAMKKPKRDTRGRLTGTTSTPTGGSSGNSKSPPKEEDDMRAAEVLQGLKGIGAPNG